MAQRQRRRSISFSPEDFALAGKLALQEGLIHSSGDLKGTPNPTRLLSQLIQKEAKRTGTTVSPGEIESALDRRRKREAKAEEIASQHFSF